MSGKRAAIGRFLKATSLTILTMACPAALSAQTPEPDYKPDHWPSIPQPALLQTLTRIPRLGSWDGKVS